MGDEFDQVHKMMAKLGIPLPDWYIIVDRKPVRVGSILDFAEWMGRTEFQYRHVGWTRHLDETVSTIFLGLDHRRLGKGPPILFETMVSGADGHFDQRQRRYCTLDQAERGHRAMCRLLWGRNAAMQALASGMKQGEPGP